MIDVLGIIGQIWICSVYGTVDFFIKNGIIRIYKTLWKFKPSCYEHWSHSKSIILKSKWEEKSREGKTCRFVINCPNVVTGLHITPWTLEFQCALDNF
jgi:hypothetical protein